MEKKTTPGSSQTGAGGPDLEATSTGTGSDLTPAAVPDPPGGSSQSAGIVSDSDTTAQNTRKTEPEAQEAHKVIRFNTETTPELDPNDPRFNEVKYWEYLNGLDYDSIEHRLNKALRSAKDAAGAVSREIAQSGISSQILTEQAAGSLKELLAINQWAIQQTEQTLLPQLKKLLSSRDSLLNFSFDWKSIIEGLQAAAEKLNALDPYLEKELAAVREQPGLEEATLDDLKRYIAIDGETIIDDSDGEPVPAAIRAALERAIEAARQAKPTVTAKRADIVEYPIDKVNSSIWNLLTETTGRQTKLALKAETDSSKKQLNILYSIDFEELEKTGLKITKQLLPYDKRVYIAVAALYNAGNTVISLTQIYYAMGNTGKPAKYQLEKINDSITKMRKANVYIDTLEESQVYNYPRFKYEDYLLPVARTSAIVNGQLAEAAIQLKGEPPLLTFAKQRKQITTITVKVLQSPISKTDANLLIDDYLIERIARAKAGKQPRKILYETLYEKTEIKTKNQRSRAPEKIKTYLDHYKACGMISGYKMKADGIEIDFD